MVQLILSQMRVSCVHCGTINITFVLKSLILLIPSKLNNKSQSQHRRNFEQSQRELKSQVQRCCNFTINFQIRLNT